MKNTKKYECGQIRDRDISSIKKKSILFNWQFETPIDMIKNSNLQWHRIYYIKIDHCLSFG